MTMEDSGVVPPQTKTALPRSKAEMDLALPISGKTYRYSINIWRHKLPKTVLFKEVF
jgi:hypothetical protein